MSELQNYIGNQRYNYTIYTCVIALIGLHIASLATSMKPMATSCTVISLNEGLAPIIKWFI